MDATMLRVGDEKNGEVEHFIPLDPKRRSRSAQIWHEAKCGLGGREDGD